MENANISNYQDLHNKIGQIHEQKRNQYENILEELREKCKFLQEGVLNAHEMRTLWEIPNEDETLPETIYYDCSSTIQSVEKSEKKKSSKVTFKTENCDTTFYLEAISESPVTPKSSKLSNKALLSAQKEYYRNEGCSTSFLKDSICTTDMNHPLGTSTPTSPDVEIQMPAQVSSTQNGSNNKMKSKIKPNSNALRDKSVNVNFSTTKLDAAQKKKNVRLNAAVVASKRKREERVQKVTAQREQREAVVRVKRQAVLKVEKVQEEKRKLVLKKKEEKTTPKVPIKAPSKKEQNSAKKKKNTTNEYSQGENETLEYDIDHVIEGNSSDEEDAPKNFIPKWATKEMREHPLNVQSWLDKSETVIPWFFSERLKQPSLEELFSTKMQLRPRTSSAVWH